MIWNDFVEEVAKFEGCPNQNGICISYVDSGGTRTIGYGFTDKESLSMTNLTVEQAKNRLSNKLKLLYDEVNSTCLKYNYDFNEQMLQSLTSFTYNLGIGNLLRLLQNGKRTPREIADSIVLYNKCGKNVLQGLVRRRNWEQTVFLSGLVDETLEKNTLQKKIQKECNSIITKSRLETPKLTVDGILGEKSLSTIYELLLIGQW